MRVRVKYVDDPMSLYVGFFPGDTEEGIRRELARARPRASLSAVARVAKELVRAFAENPNLIARLYDHTDTIYVFRSHVPREPSRLSRVGLGESIEIED